MEIRFTTGQSPLGSVLVAATDRGVCAVSLRESDEGANESLHARFPNAKIDQDDAALKPALDLVLARIAGHHSHFERQPSVLFRVGDLPKSAAGDLYSSL